MHKPKNVWAFAKMALDSNVTVYGFKIAAFIAENIHCTNNEIAEALKIHPKTVSRITNELNQQSVISYLKHKDTKLFQLQTQRQAKMWVYIATVIDRVDNFGPSHLKTLWVLENRPDALTYQIAYVADLNIWSVKKALTNLFAAKVLAPRDPDVGYKFLPILKIVK